MNSYCGLYGHLRTQGQPLNRQNGHNDCDTLSEKRYKSCHWCCTFSKGTLLYPKASYWYLSGTYSHL